jgi:hypothetical protein
MAASSPPRRSRQRLIGPTNEHDQALIFVAGGNGAGHRSSSTKSDIVAVHHKPTDVLEFIHLRDYLQKEPKA